MENQNSSAPKYLHLPIFDMSDPLTSAKGIITECRINDDIESYQELPSTLLMKSIHEDIYSFLIKTFSNLDLNLNKEDFERQQHRFALAVIEGYTNAYVDLKKELGNQVKQLGLIFWRNYYSKNPVFLNDPLLPPYQLVFKSYLESKHYPFDPIDYLGIFTALGLLVDAKNNTANDEQNAHLLALGHSVTQQLLHKVNAYQIAKEVQNYQFKRRSGSGSRQRHETYQEIYEMFMNIFNKRVEEYWQQNNHAEGIWKSQTACVKDILKLNKKGECEEPELLEKFKQIKEKLGSPSSENLQFPIERTFREMLSAKLPSIPGSEKFFSRKKPTAKPKEKATSEL